MAEASTNRPNEHGRRRFFQLSGMDISHWDDECAVFFVSFFVGRIVFMSNVQPCVRLIFILCLFVLIWKKYQNDSEASSKIHQTEKCQEKKYKTEKSSKTFIFICAISHLVLIFVIFFVSRLTLLSASSLRPCHATLDEAKFVSESNEDEII